MRRMLFLGFLLPSLNLFAQGVKIGADVHPYWSPEVGHYLEITYSIEPQSLYTTWGQESDPVVTTLALLQQGEKVIGAEKLAISCPSQNIKAEKLFPIVQSTFLPADTGQLQLTVLYGVGTELTDTLYGSFYISPIDRTSMSPLAWQEPQGKYLGPRAQFGQAVYANDSDKVHFYTQAYKLPSGQKTFFTYEIYSLDTDRPMEGYGGVIRIQSKETVQPIHGGVLISELPTGNYELRCVLNIQNMDRHLYPEQRIKFYRVNPSELARWNTSTPVDPRWMGLLDHGDSLRHWVNGMYPIASIAERQQIERFGPQTSDTAIWRFTQRFWETRHPTDALAQCTLFQNLLRRVDAQYSSRAVPGYATDRGRVFLQYGAPTLTEKRPFETDGYPYEIWQYNLLDVPNAPYQINKIFVFVNYAVAGRNYELLHSNAIGEINNTRWKIALQKRSYITEDIDDTGQTGSDKFGSRIYNNIIPVGG